MRLFSAAIFLVLAALMLPAAAAAQGPAATPQAQSSDALVRMAAATSNMAQTCQLMMQREMRRETALRPFRIAFGTLWAVLLTCALVLFVILEVQWIRLANVRIRMERQHASSA